MDRREFLAAGVAATVGGVPVYGRPTPAVRPAAFPDAAEVRTLADGLVSQWVANRPIFRHFPLAEADAPRLVWEELTAVGGGVGLRQYDLTGRPYDEAVPFRPGDYAADLRAAARDKTRLLVARRMGRIEWACWQLATTGRYTFADGHTPVVTPIRTTAARVPWGAAGADPLGDLERAVAAQSPRRGDRSGGVNFAAGSAYVGEATLWAACRGVGLPGLEERIIECGWTRVFQGVEPSGFDEELTRAFAHYDVRLDALKDLAVLTGARRLPTVRLDGAGVLDDAGRFVPFVPEGAVVLFGETAGPAWGEYRFTRAGAPHLRIERHAGRDVVRDTHCGGPLLYRPAGVAVLHVGPPARA